MQLKEEFKYVCRDVLDGAPPMITPDGDLICLPCYRAAFPNYSKRLILSPAVVADGILSREAFVGLADGV